MPASRSGVYHNLRESPWRYAHNGVVFHFASKKHYDNFAAKLVASVEKMDAEMARRCGVKVDMSTVAAFHLYPRCEPFGFYVETGDGPAAEASAVGIGPGAVDVG